jgi:hypothetical protein
MSLTITDEIDAIAAAAYKRAWTDDDLFWLLAAPWVLTVGVLALWLDSLTRR